MGKSSVKFFRDMYAPVLAKTGKREHVARENLRKSMGRENPNGFANMPKEKVREMARRARAVRDQNTPAEELQRRYTILGHLGHQSFMKLPAAQRREIAKAAARARWDNITPDERAAHAEKGRANLVLASQRKREKRLARWPFPDRMPLSVAASAARARAARQAKKRLADHQARIAKR